MTKPQLIEAQSGIATGNAAKLRRLLTDVWHAATSAPADEAIPFGLNQQQLYDIGLSDRRPLRQRSARQQIDAYSGSISAMLNRRF